MKIVCKINQMPNELLELIKEYINKKTLVFVNKTYYNLYHIVIKKYINKYESYTRDIIRRDNYLVFQQICKENFNDWLNNKQYRYKCMIINNYVYFIMLFCIENDSKKCRDILLNIFEERKFGKNLHKKNVIKYIKWKN
jgi:hypothetical protein